MPIGTKGSYYTDSLSVCCIATPLKNTYSRQLLTKCGVIFIYVEKDTISMDLARFRYIYSI